jgi:hypothetical protein
MSEDLQPFKDFCSFTSFLVLFFLICTFKGRKWQILIFVFLLTTNINSFNQNAARVTKVLNHILLNNVIAALYFVWDELRLIFVGKVRSTKMLLWA